MVKPIEILLVEDNPGDVRLTKEALKDAKIQNNLYVVTDGEAAIKFLKREEEYKDAITPDLILLDLNLPKLSGKEVLHIIKKDKELRVIPVVILTTSKAEKDILESYREYANCFITKPVDVEQFFSVVRQIEDFWFTVVKLPRHAE